MLRSICTFSSDCLKRQVSVEVLLPGGAGPWATVYLLHGLGGGARSWGEEFGLVSLAREHRVALVMPDAAASYYVNLPGPHPQNYADYVALELPERLEAACRIRADRSGRAVAGLSMGGYGAMMLALRHPERYAACASLSGSLYFAEMDHPTGSEYPTQLMAEVDRDAFSCFALADRLAGGDAPRPAVHFNCGTGDHLLDCNRRFRNHLARLGIEHHYEEFPGEHDHAYWQSRLPAALAALATELGAGE